MKKIKKLITFIGVITTLTLMVALVFPTWTSQIKGGKQYKYIRTNRDKWKWS